MKLTRFQNKKLDINKTELKAWIEKYLIEGFRLKLSSAWAPQHKPTNLNKLSSIKNQINKIEWFIKQNIILAKLVNSRNINKYCEN